MLALLAATKEPAHTAWYILGGVLALWAVVLSFFGLSRPDFPRGEGGARIVMLISVVLVAAAMTAAVATA
jgi:hypothetical protein